jgi:hypothetical protein
VVTACDHDVILIDSVQYHTLTRRRASTSPSPSPNPNPNQVTETAQPSYTAPGLEQIEQPEQPEQLEPRVTVEELGELFSECDELLGAPAETD